MNRRDQEAAAGGFFQPNSGLDSALIQPGFSQFRAGGFFQPNSMLRKLSIWSMLQLYAPQLLQG